MHINKIIFKVFLLLFLITFLFGCSSAFFSKDISQSKNEASKKGLYLSDEDITLYIGYNVALYSGDFNTAQNLLEQMVEKFPNRVDFYTDLASLYIYRRNLSRAMELINNALEISPDNVNILTMLSDVYVMKGDRKSAIAILEKVLNIDKNEDKVPLVLSNLYFQEEEYAKAVSVLTNLLGAKPNNFLAHIYLARTYEKLGKNSEAAEHYKAAFKERDEDEILISLDHVYDKLGEKEKSIDVLEKFLERNPDYPKVRERLALLYLSVNNYEKALSNYEHLLIQFPENKDIKLKYVLIAMDGGFYDKAKNTILDYLKKEPQDQKAIYYAGLLFKETKEWRKAIEYFSKISDKEYEKSAKLYLSVCYEKLGEKDNAFNVLNGYWLKEHDSEIGYYLAIFYKNKGDYKAAYKLLEELLPVSENKTKIILMLAEIHLKLNEFEKGILLVKEILEKEPDNPDAMNFIGYSYVEKGIHLDEAEKLIVRALELKPEDPYITDSLAWLYYMKKNYEKALEYQQKVILKVKDDPTILEHMGDILFALGNKKEAKEYYLKAIENEPDDLETIKRKLEDLKNY